MQCNNFTSKPVSFMSSRWCRGAEGGVLVGNHKKLSYTRKWAYVKGLSVKHFYNPHPSISRGGRPMYILRLADDIDFMAATDSQLQASPTGCSTDMEWRPGLVRANSWLTPTGKLISTSTEFEDMKRYKYLGATLSKETSTSRWRQHPA